MAEKSVTPPNPATDIGRFRFASGDTQFQPLDPAETGFGTYAYWSDDEVQAFLTAADNSLPRAIGYAYLQLAAVLGAQGRSIKTDDLALTTTGRSGDLREVAKVFLAEAAAQDTVEADDFFQFVPFAGSPSGYCPPELQPEVTPSISGDFEESPDYPGYLLP